MTIGGMTALDAHCSGSWPACRAFVANPLGCFLNAGNSLVIFEIRDTHRKTLEIELREANHDPIGLGTELGMNVGSSQCCFRSLFNVRR